MGEPLGQGAQVRAHQHSEEDKRPGSRKSANPAAHRDWAFAWATNWHDRHWRKTLFIAQNLHSV